MSRRDLDHSTATVQGAAAFERARAAGGYAFGDDDRPTMADLREDATDDAHTARRQRERDLLAASKGHYFPSPAMRLEQSMVGLHLIQRHIPPVEVHIVRDGVLRVSLRASLSPETAATVLRDNPRYEVAVRDETVWVKVVEPMRDPFDTGVQSPEPF